MSPLASLTKLLIPSSEKCTLKEKSNEHKAGKLAIVKDSKTDVSSFSPLSAVTQGIEVKGAIDIGKEELPVISRH